MDTNSNLQKISPSIHKKFKRNDNAYKSNNPECSHKFWIKRCSSCSTVMETDSVVNYDDNSKNTHLYTGFESIVCGYLYSKKLQDAGVSQNTALYWVHRLDINITTLRNMNISLEGNRVVSAYTSAELSSLLLKQQGVSDSLFEKIGRNIRKPDKLAKLYLDYKS